MLILNSDEIEHQKKRYEVDKMIEVPMIFPQPFFWKNRAKNYKPRWIPLLSSLQLKNWGYSYRQPSPSSKITGTKEYIERVTTRIYVGPISEQPKKKKQETARQD
tara:strand:+ start:359 stop:673 length:315 start_codon:yes stop_codon:yes gene_type:complete